VSLTATPIDVRNLGFAAFIGVSEPLLAVELKYMRAARAAPESWSKPVAWAGVVGHGLTSPA
jgi:hypothetical protein